MAETQKNLVTSQSGPHPHIKYHLQQKTKRMLWVKVWNFKREEGNSHRDRKANVWEPNVCRARQRQWDTK